MYSIEKAFQSTAKKRDKPKASPYWVRVNLGILVELYIKAPIIV